MERQSQFEGNRGTEEGKILQLGPRRQAIAVYEPDNSIKKGYTAIFREITREVLDNRWLTYQLFKRDFLASYKQSLFGLFWAIALPIVSLLAFVLLSRAGLFAIGEVNIPYPLYAMLGLAFWQLFSTGLVGSSNALVNAGPMVAQIQFSKKSLVFAAAGQSVVAFFIQFCLACLLMGLYRYPPAGTIVLVPAVVFPILLLALGAGFLLSILNGMMRDVGHVISILMTFLLFLTPILYAKPKMGILADLTRLNPVYYLIAGARDLVLAGRLSEPGGFAISVLFSMAAFALSLVIFHVTGTRITERL